MRSHIHARIGAMVEVFDDQIGAFICGEFDGTYAEWERHLADKLADALTEAG